MNFLLLLILCLTLGLAPFKPEPHIWEKLKWLFKEPGTMALIDYFDFILHGSPWVALLVYSYKKIRLRFFN